MSIINFRESVHSLKRKKRREALNRLKSNPSVYRAALELEEKVTAFEDAKFNLEQDIHNTFLGGYKKEGDKI